MNHLPFVSVVIAFLVWLVLPPMGLPGNDGCSILGMVTDSESGEPLPLVDVYLVDLKLRAVTGENGTYRIENVREGVHICRLALTGYLAMNDTLYVEPGSRVIERKYELTPYRPMITTTKEEVLSEQPGPEDTIGVLNTLTDIVVPGKGG